MMETSKYQWVIMKMTSALLPFAFNSYTKVHSMLQVLEAIAPPYTPEFVQLFLPMVENEEITGTMRGDGENDPVSEFIGK
jgi:hypothetical protein